jgi:hypothetical protein
MRVGAVGLALPAIVRPVDDGAKMTWDRSGGLRPPKHSIDHVGCLPATARSVANLDFD